MDHIRPWREIAEMRRNACATVSGSVGVIPLNTGTVEGSGETARSGPSGLVAGAQ